jgi:hypothetical protein
MTRGAIFDAGRIMQLCRCDSVKFNLGLSGAASMLAAVSVPPSWLRLAASLFAFAVGTAFVNAAEMRADPSHGSTGVVLEGKIEAGDFERFKSYIFKSHNAFEIYLASPGGNLGEAIKIGLLVRRLKLSTVVPSKALTNQSRLLIVARHNLNTPKTDYMCSSACFFIFIAGIHRSADDHGVPILGIHKPSVLSGDLTKNDSEQEAVANNRVRLDIEKYLKAMGVPAKYAENMYSVPFKNARWIRYDEFEADFDGFIPELGQLVKAECNDRSDGSTEVQCEREIQEQLAVEGYGDALRKQNNDIPNTVPSEIPVPLQK